MLKLMKYELRKTWMTKVILLALTAIAEAVYLYGLYGHKENPLAAGVMILILLAVFGVLVIGLESVIVLHRDMNTRQGYMLFMTPNSCYRILGAKVLECSLSILMTGAFFFALGVLDITLLFAEAGELNTFWDVIKDFLSQMTISGRKLVVDLPNVSAFAFTLLADWITLVITAYFADVISSAILNGKKFNGVVSFLLFLLLYWGMNWASTAITSGITQTATFLWASGVVSLAFAAVMYVVTARIMEKYLSV